MRGEISRGEVRATTKAVARITVMTSRVLDTRALRWKRGVEPEFALLVRALGWLEFVFCVLLPKKIPGIGYLSCALPKVGEGATVVPWLGPVLISGGVLARCQPVLSAAFLGVPLALSVLPPPPPLSRAFLSCF